MADVFSSFKAELGESIFPYIKFNRHQQKAFDSNATEKFCFGGNRSGKTFFGLDLLPNLAAKKYKIRGAAHKNKYVVWISCLDYQFIKQTMVPTLLKVCPNGWLKISEYKNEFEIVSPYGVEIKGFFKSADSGRSKYQSASVDLIILDEEHPESIYKECRARIVDTAGQIINTMTPLLGMTWVYNYSLKHFRVQMPTIDNHSLPPEEVEAFKLSLANDKEVRMRLLGEFVDLAGLKFLSEEDNRYLLSCEQDCAFYMSVVDGKLVEDKNGNIMVYERPIPGMRYLIGMDVASGTGNDYTIAAIYASSEDGIYEVARFRSRLLPIPDTAQLVYLLGQYYNDAFYLCEVNGIGIALKQCLEQEFKYNKMPVLTNQNNHQFNSVFGFTNTESARDTLLQKAKAKIQQRKAKIRNSRAIAEWLAFQYIPSKKRYDHLPEFNDDCIFADALAFLLSEYFAPSVVSSIQTVAAEPTKRIVMTFDQEDEYRAINRLSNDLAGGLKRFDPTR